MAFPIRAPRNVTELLSAEAAMRAARAAGRMDDADIIRSLLNEGSFDPELVANSRFFQQFNPDLPRPDAGAAVRFIDSLDGTDIPIPEVNLVGNQALQDIGRSYESLASGRLRNLNNQRTGLIDAARQNIFEAAAARRGESSFRDPLPLSKDEKALQQAGQIIDRRELPVRAAMRDRLSPDSSEELGRIAAAAAIIGGVGGLAGDTISGLGQGGMAEAESPELQYPELERLPPPPTDITMPDVDLLPVDDAPIPSMPMATMTDEDMGLTDFSPMDTADLVAESRPIPDSTPTVERLTPEEIARLRPQVISIRDAKTGQAMDSFYPPESEEYKREQRMKQRYSNLRMR